jgi:hypothetical protein
MKLLLAVLFTLTASTAAVFAQLSGSNLPGDLGMKSGSQAPPGAYLSYFLIQYDASTIAGSDGREIQFERGGLDIWAHALGLSAVSRRTFGRANYGATLFLPLQNLSIEAPRVGLSDETAYGLGDMWIQPVSLGWHLPRADITTWYALYAPTGRYEPGGEGNRGFGMWSHELTLGSTVYFNEAKSLHASAMSAFEFHSEKEDSNAQVGNLLTVEGGAGATIKRAIDLGMAYYLQWKLSEDSGLDLPALVEDRLGKNRNFGLGPEASLVLPLSQDLNKLMILNFRYEFDMGTRLDTNGETLLFSATFKVL